MPAHDGASAFESRALESLLLPLRDDVLAWPSEGALFLGARDGWPLHRQPLPGLVCVQDFKPEVDALQRSGFELTAQASDSADPRRWPLVLVLPPRQRDEARALLVRALDQLAPGGRVLVSMPNNEGARSGESDLMRIAGPLRTLSKHHCRTFWTAPLQAPADPGLAAQWRVADAPRPILDGRFVSRPGVFAWDRIDPASALLAAHLPGDLAGHGADLGCGYGFLASEVLARCAGVTALDLYEAQARALALAQTNLQALAAHATLRFHWHDVTAGIAPDYDFIVSNPPFHAQGRAERPDVGRDFIAAAAMALKPGGQLWLVANRHLPYEAVLDASFGQVRIVAQRDGFKVVQAIRRA